ncbi:MAG: hypothetical protein AAGF92_22975 [Myxococcota bacterium]
MCATDLTVRELVPMYGSAARSLVRAWSDSGDLEVRSGRIVVPPNEPCVHYQTRFYGEVFRTREEEGVIVSQSQWLWRPRPFPNDTEVRLALTLPPGTRASFPFEHGDGSSTIPRDAFYRDGHTVFGNFEESQFTVGNTTAAVALLGPSPDEATVRRWLSQAIRTAGSVGNRGLPVERVQFVVAPVEGTGRPVAFGMVRRGGGPSVLLLPSSAAPVEALERDWVAVHELSHLWLPRLYDKDRWLSEGIATYLQELLRARCGLQTAEESWKRLHDGMSRGRRSGTGRVLDRESREMGRTGAYHRVYWSGAAFALEADLRLRQASGGSMTLPRALNLAREKRGEVSSLVKGADFLAELDAAAGTDFLAPLGDRYASLTDFPKTPMMNDPALEELRDDVMRVDVRCSTSDASSR